MSPLHHFTATALAQMEVHIASPDHRRLIFPDWRPICLCVYIPTLMVQSAEALKIMSLCLANAHTGPW